MFKIIFKNLTFFVLENGWWTKTVRLRTNTNNWTFNWNNSVNFFYIQKKYYFIFLLFRTLPKEIQEISISSTTVHEDEVVSSSLDEKSISTSETDQDLRSFLNSLAAHLLPELPTSFDDETEDEQSFKSETKSVEEPISQGDQIVDSMVQKSIEEANEEWNQSQDRIPSDQIKTVDETK